MKDVRHIVIAKEFGRFYGWPANIGMWMWGNEILVGAVEGGADAARAADRDVVESTLLYRLGPEVLDDGKDPCVGRVQYGEGSRNTGEVLEDLRLCRNIGLVVPVPGQVVGGDVEQDGNVRREIPRRGKLVG